MGPCLAILLRTALDHDEVAQLDQRLRQLDEGVATGNRFWDLTITDGKSLGIPEAECNRSCSFMVVLGETTEYEDLHDQFMAQLGYFPPQSISICAGCKKDIDHLITCHLALWLLELHDGLLHNGDLVDGPIPNDIKNLGEFPKYNGPGRIIELQSEYPPFYLVDKVYFRARLRAGKYHLLK